MSDQADAAIDAAFDNLTRAASGAGVEAQQLVDHVHGHKAMWTNAAEDTASKINDLYDSEANEFMPLSEKQARTAKAQAIYNAAQEASARAMQTKLGILESVAWTAAESDLELAPAADRALIRDDIRSAIANLPPSASRASALLALAQANPKKYAAEMVKDDFAVNLLKSVGEASGAAELRTSVIRLTPGSTPKAVAGRALLKALPQVVGSLGGLRYFHNARVEAAAKPRIAPRHIPVNLTRS